MLNEIKPSRAAQSPEELMQRFSECVRERELDRLVALYEPDAVFVPQPGVVLVGHEAIRGALAEMFALEPVMEMVISEVHTTGDTALVLIVWKMTGRAPDGSVVKQSGKSADVLRRQKDGSWLVLIDHP